MDTALILADELLKAIRRAGVTKVEAYAALHIANAALPSISDITFDAPDPVPAPLSPVAP